MAEPRELVDYSLRRRLLLADLRAGRRTVDEACDADEYLLRAARFHGEPLGAACPVCRNEKLTVVLWVHGETLGRISGSARAAEEIADLAETREAFQVHEVEVCRSCRWNHLDRSYVLGLPGRPRGRVRRTAAE